MKNKMGRNLLLSGIAGLWLLAIPAGSRAATRVVTQMPPLIVFASPPQMVVIPETYVYVIPETNEDIYFYNGYYYRPWRGRWYRSRYYDRGWGQYSSTPAFYRQVPPGWRQEYVNHQWKGRPWNYQPISHQRVQKNWNSWQKNRYWENHNTWGVQGMPKPLRQPQARPQGKHGRQPQARSQGNEGQRPQAQPSGRQGPKHHDQKK